MEEYPNAAKELAMWDKPLPNGWVILGYGIDASIGNKYIRIALPNGIVASIVSGLMTYGGKDGLWEIAPCWYGGGNSFSLMTCEEMRAVVGWTDVHGWLDTDGVNEALSELADVDSVRVHLLRDAFMRIRAHENGR